MTGQFVIVISHFFGHGRIFQHLASLVHRIFGDVTVKLDHMESLRFYIKIENGIVIHQNRPVILDGFQKCIPKTLEIGRTRNQRRLWVNILQSINVAIIFGFPALIFDNIRNK